ncbi:MAG: hypothetical protein ACI4XM_07665 [Candidatus Coprovivens sp.]
MTLIDKFLTKLPSIIYIIIGTISIYLIIVGFLNDKKKQSTNRKIKTILLTSIITFILVLIYINPIYQYRNHSVIKHLDNIKTKETIEIKELIPFTFDKIYIANPYTSKDQIEKELNLKSRYIKDNNINDNYQEIIIIKDNKVISSILVNYSITPISSTNIIENKDNYIFKISKKDNIYYFEETLKKTQKQYKNITYTIPITWYEEKKEEYQLYYIDEKSYITIKELTKYNEKNYQKNLTIIEEKNLPKEFFEIKYYKIKIDEKNIEQRIIIKDDTIYEIILCSSINDNIEYYQELLNIIDSLEKEK